MEVTLKDIYEGDAEIQLCGIGVVVIIQGRQRCDYL